MSAGQCPVKADVVRPVRFPLGTGRTTGRTDGQAKMEVEMVAKKGRGRPKPDKVYYAPCEGARRLRRS